MIGEFHQTGIKKNKNNDTENITKIAKIVR
jgi:hypothetical protein